MPQATPPNLDWADSLALDLMVDAAAHPYVEARKLIAAKLRVVRANGAAEGCDALAEQLERRAREHETC